MLEAILDLVILGLMSVAILAVLFIVGQMVSLSQGLKEATVIAVFSWIVLLVWFGLYLLLVESALSYSGAKIVMLGLISGAIGYSVGIAAYWLGWRLNG